MPEVGPVMRACKALAYYPAGGRQDLDPGSRPGGALRLPHRRPDRPDVAGARDRTARPLQAIALPAEVLEVGPDCRDIPVGDPGASGFGLQGSGRTHERATQMKRTIA